MTKTDTVKGLMTKGKGIKTHDITVRVTVGYFGRSISFSDDESVMLHVPVESIKELLQFALWG